MARLPMLVQITDLRFTADDRVTFTLEWPADINGDKIDHIRVRFLMTNLLSIGGTITEDEFAGMA